MHTLGLLNISAAVEEHGLYAIHSVCTTEEEHGLYAIHSVCTTEEEHGLYAIHCVRTIEEEHGFSRAFGGLEYSGFSPGRT